MSLIKESPIRYRSASTNFNTGSGLKLLNSTSSSFGVGKLIQQNSGTGSNFFTRRTSFSLTKNAQGKLDNLKDELTYLTSDILQTRNTTKVPHLLSQQASLYLKFMKEDLHDRKLPDIDSDLKQQVQVLKKQIAISARSDKLRYQGVWQAVAGLQRSTRTMSNRLFELKNYITRLENAMGFYSGADKHRF